MPAIGYLLRGPRQSLKSFERPFVVKDANSRGEAVAYTYANASAPDGYTIDDYDFREYYPMSRTLHGSLRCKRDYSSESSPLPDPGYSFNYTGGQIFMQRAISTTPYGTVPDDDTTTLIHFNRDAHTVDGVTLPMNNDTVQLTKTVYLRESEFDLWSDLYPIYFNRYRTNTEAWGSWPVGGVLYLGASGNLNNHVWTINYQVAVGANRTGASDIVPDFTINKTAHQYVETWFAMTKGESVRFKKPVGVKVHTVYNTFSLSSLTGLGATSE